jgi:hypothetical protein
MQIRHATTVLLVLSLVAVPVPRTGATAQDASIERLEAWQAPANETAFDSADDVRAAIENGTLSRATGVNDDDVLVLELRFQEFDEAVANASGSTTTERFQTALTEHGDLVIRQTNMGPMRAPVTIDALDQTGVEVFAADDDTYYVRIDLSEAVVLRNDDSEQLETDRPYTFVVQAELAADSPLTAERSVALTAVDQRSATVETERDGTVQLQPRANQTIAGTANVGTGSTVTLVLSGDANPRTDGNESVRLTREATVTPTDDHAHYEGAFAATFDLRDVSPAATNVTVDVRIDNRSLLEEPAPAVIANRRATVRVHDLVETGGFVGVNVTADLSAGGFLAVHGWMADGLVVGHTPYLERGEHTVTVYLDKPTDADNLVVVAYRDENFNQWFDGVETESRYSTGAPEDAIVVNGSRLNDTLRDTPTPDNSTDDTLTPGDTPTPDERDPTPTPATTQTSPTATPSPSSTGGLGTLLPVVGVLLVGTLLVTAVQYRRN